MDLLLETDTTMSFHKAAEAGMASVEISAISFLAGKVFHFLMIHYLKCCQYEYPDEMSLSCNLFSIKPEYRSSIKTNR